MATVIRRVLIAAVIGWVGVAQGADTLRPYVLGNPVKGTLEQVAATVNVALKRAGFSEAGRYSPYDGAIVLVVTCPELQRAAGQTRFGGFGAGQRVAITRVDRKVQVSYVNPAYLGSAYGLGSLAPIADKLRAALGATRSFGSAKGLTPDELAPGAYHYMTGMPYFHNVDFLGQSESHEAAVQAVENGLADRKGGTRKVYRIDLPGKDVSVFGVAIDPGDGIDRGYKDSDREVMALVNGADPRPTAYLPYEVLVSGRDVVALRSRYRFALHFPDTALKGRLGFSEVLRSSRAIQTALASLLK